MADVPAVDSASPEKSTPPEEGTAQAAPGLEAAPPSAGRTSGTAIAGVLSVAALALLALSGSFGYSHWQAERDARERSEILDAARQGVVNLTTMNFERADEDVQRVLDGAAGEFRDEFEARSKDLVAVMQEARVQSEGEVRQAAIESQSGDSADVIVAVAQKISNAGGASEEPRGQRMRVTVQLDDGRYKIVKAGFVQ
ncbi:MULTISPECIES: hypothetical protein [Rhodococcus]|uniref:Mce-associated membrane protein n=1 Tax=Rhodococcus oxybenzonivorans TaxID=1990687 RepID=A0AAE4UZS2_9NOCA|nr:MULTISPECIES: hypothetical protein [Rhodococcus]MDV7245099.1 hypothetical protein [Rhodococcus oxybenzonivorans]MDV7266145.1 hypothetical protein [Rhodococcus oxybenzonivorans]MDV7272618.1 hypothetical protein [Rhodococcus oxybenzonivorans]MDV7336124.1 hypothetical protein [Rhodococcus oxybenzonivorans]MDV7342810.1 hypothetical protein [Rhodococcus oxybenzonivorans]